MKDELQKAVEELYSVERWDKAYYEAISQIPPYLLPPNLLPKKNKTPIEYEGLPEPPKIIRL